MTKISYICLFRTLTVPSPSRMNLESTSIPEEEIQGSDKDSIDSNNTLVNYDYELSSSSSVSELDLSLAVQSNHDDSTLTLSNVDNEVYDTSTDNDDDDDNYYVSSSPSLTPIQTISSDNESVLYLRLTHELNMGEATFDSDIDRIDA